MKKQHKLTIIFSALFLTLRILLHAQTLNYIPKWTPNTSTFGNSQLFDNGTSVGIGTTSPEGTFHIQNASSGHGLVRLGTEGYIQLLLEDLDQADAVAPYRYLQSSGGSLSIGSAQRLSGVPGTYTNHFLINNLGNVGIGTITPANKLEVTTATANDQTIRATNTATSGSNYAGVFIVNGAATTNIGLYANAGNASSNYSLHLGTLSAGSNNYSLYSPAVAKSYFAGDLGIGTTTPGTKLHVVNNAASLRLQGTDHTFMEFFPDGPGSRKAWFGYGAASDNNITIANEISGGHILLNPNGASVGIGTASPLAKVHVSGGSLLIDGTNGVTPTSGAGPRMMWIPSKIAFRAGNPNSDTWDDANIGSYSVAFGLRTTASGSRSFATGEHTVASGFSSFVAGSWNNSTGRESASFGSNNNATGDFSAAFGYNTTTSGLYSMASGNNLTAQPFSSFVIGQYNIISGTTSSWVATEPLFVIGNGTSTSARSNAVTVLKNGKTLIGNPSLSGFMGTPDGYLLFVQQGILAEKVKVAVSTTASWADYVFDKRYKLRDLNELEAFIQKNKHLPNIPSAEEVVKNGIDMATMDAKLLEKIEELSLYVIQQNKEIEQMKKELKALKK